MDLSIIPTDAVDSEILDMILTDSDPHDPWATAMAWAFAVCDRMWFVYAEMPPAEMEYRPSPIQTAATWDPESFEDFALAELNPSVEDMRAALAVLHAWIEQLRAAGADY